MDLDFSQITDDQLEALVRACCDEALRRNPAIAAAVRDVMIDAAERARIMRAATDAEAAALRAQERERVAAEAREKIRAEEAAKNAAQEKRRAEEAARRAADKARAEEEQTKNWLRQFADLTGTEPGKICIVVAKTRYGHRLMVNEGSDRYARDHIVDYNFSNGKIKTVKRLIKGKPALVELAVKFGSDPVFLAGEDYDWST